ncbi:hypothetical protein [Streptomyces sp. NBC_01497]|uniref:hypothetical protein n=1 Tax=Streptomyces sp. NBC_01497 TaxID=2903885 RepID=UPI002E34EC9C|nr:hypothetical protein [Streptomyces sp. NBC_01497]
MRLVDLQRSAIRLLTTASRTESFQQLAQQHGVKGIKVGPYGKLFTDLDPTLTSSKGRVKKAGD